MRIREAHLACLVLVLGLIVALPAPGAQAQNGSVQELVNRIDRLQRELVILQRDYYQVKPNSDRASRTKPVAKGGMSRRLAARLEIRLSRLESEIRTLTGKTEELQHSVGRFESRFTKLVSDVDLRLSALEHTATTPEIAKAESTPGTTAPPPAGAATQIPVNNSAPNAPPQALGTIPSRAPNQNTTVSAPARVDQSAALPKHPTRTPKELYDDATSLLLDDQNSSGAERALKSFIKDHPEHELASNAYYWLGETYYVRKLFKQAAYAFAEGYQRFPKGNKAPDYLLKLGMAFGQLGKDSEACTAFLRLLTSFPNINKRLKGRAQLQRQRYQCR